MRHHSRRRKPGGLPTVGAVAVDLGASSIRFAHGRLVEGVIEFQVVKQEPNTPKGRCWDIDLLVRFVQEAAEFAASHGSSLGIDSWGVDHGFINDSGEVILGPVMYRDASHSEKCEQLRSMRRKLYELTGIAHQPFNTVYQLMARMEESPDIVRECEWLVMPDLLNFLLCGVRRHEKTQASTTQLMGTDGVWSTELFTELGLPFPKRHPQPSGEVIGSRGNVPIVGVASHDTASAVLGVGELAEGDAYLNVGTWALLGVVAEKVNCSERAEGEGWTNEWGYGDSIRFLKNIPGFYVLNRVHEELGVPVSIGEWLGSRSKGFQGRFDPQHASLYNPESMLEACAALCSEMPADRAEWAQAALASLVECIAEDVPRLAATSGQPIRRLRVVGGGSRSEAFCSLLADTLGMPVLAGPVEATLLGNLVVQFAATGSLGKDEVGQVVARSTSTRLYEPGG
ncbi:MAG: hypothetical protein JSS66_10405 [Armatimonadetes bacterium]|nr:hypothetical protein [Armatimonadota bacterium]